MERSRKSYNLVAGIGALLMIIAVTAAAGYIVSRPEPPVIQGEAEANEYRISSKVPGRIEEFLAEEGDEVHAGDTLVVIDSPEVRAKLTQASAMKNAAEAQSSKIAAGADRKSVV